MRTLSLGLILISLIGCIAVRVPQLPVVDRVVNPGGNPRSDERWILEHGEYVHQFIPLDIRDGTIFLGGAGEYVVLSAAGFIKAVARSDGSEDFYTWRHGETATQARTVFQNGRPMFTESCEQVTSGEQRCTRSGRLAPTVYRYEKDAQGRIVLYEWSHPSTGLPVRLSPMQLTQVVDK